MWDDRSTTVVAHYSHGELLAAILRGLAATGKSTDPIDSDDLAAGDEFHIGGRAATSALFDQLGWRPGVQVVDVGCGIGGPARYLARHREARVTGVDLTPEFVEVARELTRRFWVEHERDRREFGIESLSGIGHDFATANLVEAMRRGLLAPTEMISTATACLSRPIPAGAPPTTHRVNSAPPRLDRSSPTVASLSSSA